MFLIRLIALTVMFAVAELAALSAPCQGCEVTKPNGSSPPGEQWGPRAHGNGALWVLLWPSDGKVIISHGETSVLPDGSVSVKFGWWRGVPGKLVVQGKRLDAAAPRLRARIPEGYGNIGGQPSGLIFPTRGCWQVTGKVGRASLTFVIEVKGSDSKLPTRSARTPALW